ncbi:MAG: M28 family peptidase [Gemmatimonadetes bacterium]|nr:M28 family peptidase [Gemmatimonadota bacterium]
MPAFNVVATIPGTELPDEYVVLSAHLDLWDGASGTTDNATGTIMIHEASIRLLARRYLAELPHRTRHVARIGANQEPIVAEPGQADPTQSAPGLSMAMTSRACIFRPYACPMIPLSLTI